MSTAVSAPTAGAIVHLAGSNGSTIKVAAFCAHGQWVVHRCLDSKLRWVVSHVTCGLKAATFDNKRTAIAVAQLLAPLEFSKRSAGEFLRRAQGMAGHQNVMPLSKRAASELRAVRDALVEAGVIGVTR
jgi:hypothetical protein